MTDPNQPGSGTPGATPPPPWAAGPPVPPAAELSGTAATPPTWAGQPYSGYTPPPAPGKRRSWFAQHKLLTGLSAAAVLLVGGGVAVAAAAGRPAACKTAMAAAIEKATSGDGDLVGADRPSACDGLDTATLQRLAGEVISDKADDVLEGTALDPSSTASSAADGVQETTPTAPEVGYTPQRLDFTLGLKTLDKECFGSAGCNVEVRVDFTRISDRVPQDGTFEVTYELRGGQDGAVIGTISVDEGQYDAP